jgi:hypothetical protein
VNERSGIRNSILVIALATLPPAAAQAQSAGSPFLDDAKAGVALRSMWFDRELPNAKSQETWAAGAGLWGGTGYWRDTLSLGARLYAELPLYAPKDKDGGLLLEPGQEGYSVLGEAWTKLKYDEQILTLFRQGLGANPQKATGVRSLQTDLNYLGTRDIRMVPLTYEAAMLNGAITKGLSYQFGYVDKVKDINSDKFVSMSRLAGVTTKDTGLWNGGLQWNPAQDMWVQGFYYDVKDVIRIAYTDFDWVNRISKDSYWRTAAQYSDQRSDGANLLTGSAFKSWNAGLYGEYGWTWLRLYAAASSTGAGQAMRSPYSFGPFYIGQRIKTFNRAGEDALMAGTTFDLAGFGLPGFSIDLNAADGRHAIDAATRAALPKWREYDTDFIYLFAKESVVPNMRLRLRYGTVAEDFGTRTDRTDDLRFDVNWAVNFN